MSNWRIFIDTLVMAREFLLLVAVLLAGAFATGFVIAAWRLL